MTIGIQLCSKTMAQMPLITSGVYRGSILNSMIISTRMHSNKALVITSALNCIHIHSRFSHQKVLPALSHARTQSQCSGVWMKRGFHTSRRADLWMPPITRALVERLEKYVPAFRKGKEDLFSKRTASTDSQEESPEVKIPEEMPRQRRWARMAAILVAQFFALWSIFHFFYHMEMTPLTDRWRYVAITGDEFIRVAEFQLDDLLKKHQVLDESDPLHEKVQKVVNYIVHSNRDFFTETNWKVIVTDSPDTNVHVLLTGHVVVDRGLVELTQGDTFLTSVLAHEFAHTFLNHSGDKIKNTSIVFNFLLFYLMMFWAPFNKDSILQLVYNMVQKVLETPHAGEQEREADQVALIFLAKACFDVREFSNVYRLLDLMKYDSTIRTPEYLTMHPTFEDRIRKTDETIDKALDVRAKCKKCLRFPLSVEDPRKDMKTLHDELMRRKQEHTRAIEAAKAAAATS